MALWHLWTSFLADALAQLSAHLGLPTALAIVVLTLAVRAALLPLSFVVALRADANKRRMQALKPRLEALRAAHASDGAALSAATLALYREQGISLFDRLTLANIVSQSAFGLAFCQVLRRAAGPAPFLWIADLAKPDTLLTIAVGALMFLSMLAMPGATAESQMLVTICISVAVAVVAMASMPAAVGVYWAASNAMTLVQALLLRAVLARRAPMRA
jgi:YidC/Oxa1 family membrane protein insertase